MARDAQYEALLSMYNIALAKAKDLQEQIQTKETAWGEKEKWYKLIDKLCREFCENVLAKDPNEMVLGQEYSWGKLDSVQLIQKAQKCFKEYNDSRTQLLSRVMDESERRRQQVESLEDQISQFFAQGGGPYKNVQDLKESVERQKEEEQAKQNAPNAAKKAEKDQNVQMMVEENADEVEGEVEAIQEMIRVNQSVKITPRSSPVENSQIKKKKIQKAKREETMAHMVDLVEYEQKIDDLGWDIMEVIGRKGISRYSLIKKHIQALHSECGDSKLHNTADVLTKMDVLYREKVGVPLLPNIYVYSLGDIGTRLFLKRFGSDPVEGERGVVIAEHDNLEHGYGIVTIAEMLQEQGCYQEVNAFNRKHPVKISGSTSYVPDIWCRYGKRVDYIEYERGTHTQTDFSAKCNKMAKVTKRLNFITPNKSTLETVQKQLETWMNERGKEGLRSIEEIRLATAVAIRGKDVKEDDVWQIVYQPRISLKPIQPKEGSV